MRATTSGPSSVITFAWRVPVSYQHSIQGGRLTVRFSRPIEGRFRDVIDGTDGLVSDPRPGSDGRSVSYALNAPVEVFGYYSGTAVTIELLRGETESAAAPVSKQIVSSEPVTLSVRSVGDSQVITNAQAVPADAPNINVRTGEHTDYTRIVFDFDEATPYEIANEEGIVTLKFSRPAQINVEALNTGSIALLGGARLTFSDGETVLTMAVPATSPVRDFLSGTKIVVDVREPTGSAEPVDLPAEVAETPESTLPAAPVLKKQVAAPSPSTAVASPTPSLTEEREQDNIKDGRPRALTPTGNPPVAIRNAAPSAPISEELSARAGAPADGSAPTSAVASAAPGQDQLTFRFDFTEPVAAATFRRGGAVWIVFDTPMIVDTAGLQLQAGEGAFEILQFPNKNGTVLRIRTSQRYNPSVARDGLAWIFNLAPRQMAPQAALDVTAQPNSPVGARVFIPVPEPGRAISVTDPNIGDNFVVVPVIPLGQAIGRKYVYPQFNIQVSAQGIVINPLIDDLRVRPLRQGIEIGGSGVRLAITNVSADAAAHAQLAATRTMVLALEGLAKYYVPISEFRVAHRRYENEVSSSNGRDRASARLELAKFFFANGYAPETLGVVRVAIDDIPLLEDDPSVRILRGGANFLMGRYDEALNDFTHESLEGNDEGRLWAAATNAVIGDRIGSARDLRFTGSIARDYPRALKMPLGILIAEVSAETGDGQGAKLFFEALNLENPRPAEEAMLKYAEGKLHELDGNFEVAIAAWEEVLAGDHRPSRARARVARTEMLLKLRRIDHREAIEEYEKLRFAWRGDRREFSNLRRLGSLYLDEGFYREGLSTLKSAATHFREFPEAPEITKQMSDTFNALFLGNEADQLDPVKAIAIYNEFKELTPAGARGDEMIRNLADKLVEVDLLDRAAGILQAQVQFRLQGEEKARVGARLALIYTFAREYEKGLDVLDGTAGAGISEDMVTQRRHLRAQVLMGLNRDAEALALLERDDSEPADLLRTELFWTSGNWLEAAKSLRLLVKSSGAKADEAIDDRQAARLINYAIALTNSGGERAVSQLKRDYGTAMAGTKFAEAFSLVTTPSVIGVLAPGRVSAKVQEAETFLTAYRSKLKQGMPLSSLN